MASRLPSLWDRTGRESDPFHSLHREIDKVFDDFGRDLAFPWHRNGDQEPRMLMPKLDVAETDGEIVVSADLPGVEEKDIDVTIADDILTIKASRASDREEKEADYHLIERTSGTYQRSIRLPHADADKTIDAQFHNGVLTVKLPKAADAATKRRRIEVKSG